jgi:excisionase family DNA binding protein
MKHNGPRPDVVTVNELAGILGIGKTVAYNAVNSGQIRSLRVGRRLLIPRTVVNQLLESKPKDKPETNTAVASQIETAPPLPAHRVLRGGARLSSEQLNEFNETVSSLSDMLRDVGDMVMRLRRIRDELLKKSHQP